MPAAAGPGSPDPAGDDLPLPPRAVPGRVLLPAAVTVGRMAPRDAARAGTGRYDADVLAPGWRRPTPVPDVPAERDLVVEDAESGFCGAVVGCEKGAGG